MFQFYNLIPSLTARENVELVTDIATQPLPAAEALGVVGLGERLDHFPSQLSGGEQQRVAIARAIATRPDVLLSDLKHWQQPTSPAIVEYLRVSEQQALTRLRTVVPKEAHTWCRPHELLVTGKPYMEILRTAQEQDVHLIVMGVHGRNPIDLMFFGSTTHHVVRGAACPVLTLRE